MCSYFILKCPLHFKEIPDIVHSVLGVIHVYMFTVFGDFFFFLPSYIWFSYTEENVCANAFPSLTPTYFRLNVFCFILLIDLPCVGFVYDGDKSISSELDDAY